MRSKKYSKSTLTILTARNDEQIFIIMARPRKNTVIVGLSTDVYKESEAPNIADSVKTEYPVMVINDCTCNQLPKDGMSYKCTDCVDREFNFSK